jgi:hypothetical protein
MFIGSTLCVLVLMALLSVNSQELFEVAPTDFTVDIVATLHVLAHSVKDPCPVLNIFTR